MTKIISVYLGQFYLYLTNFVPMACKMTEKILVYLGQFYLYLTNFVPMACKMTKIVLKERGGWIVKEGGPQNRLRYVSNL